MKNLTRRIRTIALVAVMAAAGLVMAGCGTVVTFTPVPSRSANQAPAGASIRSDTLLPVRNNATIRLQAARYVGDLEITANSVTLEGQGPGRTIINGRLIIRGNAFTARDLTVNGEVVLYGNAANLTRAEIRGSVRDFGNANRK